ncbi:MAG TPA: MarR family transcriptional regulator, partial [Humibacter sp.]|nr:MarR family transcriptional regulator [Humibacter sp.]
MNAQDAPANGYESGRPASRRGGRLVAGSSAEGSASSTNVHTGVEAGSQPDPFIDPRVLDPERVVVDTTGLADDEVDQIVRVLAALRRWRESEDASLDESRRTMQLGSTDMRAMRYLAVLHGRGEVATPGGLAIHLGISTASVTKLLDRLESAGHIQRQRHPTDRRGVVIALSPDSHHRLLEGV